MSSPSLYPEIEPSRAGELDVGDGQLLYWETVGNPEGLPAVFLHGGPGSGSSTWARRRFDPERFHAVLFDQRGSGRSRPLASDPGSDLSANTTRHLVADIELLREHLGIDRWIVVGVSWGVTLGLVYAQRHPDRVIAMALGVVTAGTPLEIDWITRQMGRLFPREWEQFVSVVPSDQRGGDLARAYARLLADPDEQVREDAARSWCAWEDTHISLMPGWTPDRRFDDPAFRMVFARLVTHYWSHACFLQPDEIDNNMSRLADIPAVLVHGRHDVSGPLETAWRLHRAWPASRLVLADDAGHGGASFTEHFVGAIDELGQSATKARRGLAPQAR